MADKNKCGLHGCLVCAEDEPLNWYDKPIDGMAVGGEIINASLVGDDPRDPEQQVWQRDDGTLFVMRREEVEYPTVAEMVTRDAEMARIPEDVLSVITEERVIELARDFAMEMLERYGRFAPRDSV